ncbi:MAG: sigma-70 family RNA polymerase sigma factor [Planctomycetota bacterium]
MVPSSPGQPKPPGGVGSVTEILTRAGGGDENAVAQLLPLVYEELRRLARSYLGSERSGHTLQATALVHEAYVRLIGSDQVWTGRAHFMAVAAVAMRRVLVDHARRRKADKRGGDAARLELTDADAAEYRRDIKVLELDDLLEKLARLDPRRARVVELKFFAGMTNEQIAEVLGIARSTAAEDWAVARAWLAAEMSPADASPRHPT